MNKESPILALSASRVNTYKQCPRKYYYTYKAKLPSKDWPHFTLGTLVHGVLERFHGNFRRDDQEFNLKRMMKLAFKAQRNEMESTSIINENIFIEARDLLIKYLHSMEEEGIGSSIIALEDSFNIPLNKEFNIKGIVDRVDIDRDGIYHIKDYKTSKSYKYLKPFQLETYGIYLLDKYENIDRFRASYIMVRFGGKHILYDLNKEDVEKCKKELIEYGNNIIDESRWIPKTSGLCNWCDFNETCLSNW
ncbi:MAG: RecB family exonuclease [Candidatus Hodarchaeales archaeon]|jgi:CRISPR/Cas system-associated exonuclease Cas4 (RecB family)